MSPFNYLLLDALTLSYEIGCVSLRGIDRTNSCNLLLLTRDCIEELYVLNYRSYCCSSNLVAVVCKVIRCRRWPVAKKQEILVSDDIRLEEIEGCDNREQQQQQQQQQVPADSTTLPLTSTTEQRGASPQESPHPLPHGGVVTTEEVHEQLEAEAGFTPQPVEVQVEMSEVPQLPVQFQPVQHYQLSQPLYDSSSGWHMHIVVMFGCLNA